MLCRVCGDDVSEGRAQLGFKLCLFCGEEQARQDRRGVDYFNAPMQTRGNVLHGADCKGSGDQSGINNKGGLVK